MNPPNRKSQCLLLLLLVVGGVQIAAQSTAKPYLQRLTGTWQGAGKAFGADAQLRIQFEEVLGNKFVRLSLKNQMRTASGQTQSFEGHAYYQLKSESVYEATWFDSRGISFPIKAQVEGDALIALWGMPEQEQGKSVYRLTPAGQLEVIDSVKQKDGTWKEFGRFVVSREVSGPK